MEGMDEAEMMMVYGIPMEWFREVELACDAFFRRRGMRVESWTARESISREKRIGKLKREARERGRDD